MTDELVECFNCGRSNPEWAQVCRACGVPLRHGEPILAPAGRLPTDRDSLLSIGAVIGTILVAVLLGLFVSGLNPTEPSVGLGLETPTPSPTVQPSPSESSAPSETPAPSVSAAPAGPAGTLVFGTALDENDQVIEPTDTFTAGMNFAHTVTIPEPWGVSNIGEQVVRILDDGTEEEVQGGAPIFSVVPDLTYAGFEVPVDNLFTDWGPGIYEMRVFAGEVLMAVGRFTLAEG